MAKLQSEKLVERTLRDRVRGRGGLCIKLVAVGMLGLPDRLVLLEGGKVLFVELKSGGKKPTKLQLRMHERIRNLGFLVYVIDDTSLIDDILEC